MDPDVPRAERVAAVPQRSRAGSAQRRRAEPRLLWGRVLRAVVRRRDVLFVIAFGGALGSLGRWGLTEVLPHRPGAFAWSTFVANVSGCFLIGLLMVFVIEVWPPSRYVRPFLGVGILGGYTTFSTYVLDARAMLVTGNTGVAGVYLFGSIAAGCAAVWLAVFAARGLVRLSRRRRNRRWERLRGEAHDPSRHHAGKRQDTGAERPGAVSSRSLHRSDHASRRMP